MQSDEFEKAFGDFLERYEYDDMQNTIFTMTRKAFEAGWQAAGGESLPPQEIYKLIMGNTNTEKNNSIDDNRQSKKVVTNETQATGKR